MGLGLVVAAELDGRVDEDRQCVGRVGVCGMGCRADVVSCGELMERELERTVCSIRGEVVRPQADRLVDGELGLLDEIAIATAGGTGEVERSQALPDRAVVGIGGDALLELCDLGFGIRRLDRVGGAASPPLVVMIRAAPKATTAARSVPAMRTPREGDRMVPLDEVSVWLMVQSVPAFGEAR